jgi:hypothetical protein
MSQNTTVGRIARAIFIPVEPSRAIETSWPESIRSMRTLSAESSLSSIKSTRCFATASSSGTEAARTGAEARGKRTTTSVP